MFFLRELFAKSSLKLLQKTFEQWVRVDILLAFRALLGRAARYNVSANDYALPQTLVRRTASSRSLPIFNDLLQIALYR